MKVGYARVSSKDQSLEIQIKELEAAGCERIYCEKVSGKNVDDRSELQAVLKFVRAGDVVVVTKLDRLARSTLDTLNIVINLGDRGVTFVSLAENWITTDGPSGKLILTIFAGFAEFERARLKERQMAGIKAAREKGVYQRKRKRRADAKAARLQEIKDNHPGATATQVAKAAGVNLRAVYRALPGQFGEEPDWLRRRRENGPEELPPRSARELQEDDDSAEEVQETAENVHKAPGAFRIFSRTAPNARR